MALLRPSVRGMLRSLSVVSGRDRPAASIPLAARRAASACSRLKTGSPKPAKGRKTVLASGRLRSVVSALADGSTDTACVRTSQGTVRYAENRCPRSVGAAVGRVTSTAGGTCASGPCATTSRLVARCHPGLTGIRIRA